MLASAGCGGVMLRRASSTIDSVRSPRRPSSCRTPSSLGGTAPAPASCGPAKPAEPASQGKRSLNEVLSDERFRTERFYTEKKVTALEAADLDGDGKPDLVYYGDPNELEVVYQKGEWGSRREKVAIG